MSAEEGPPRPATLPSYIDEFGRRITVCPPAWAEGATPGPSARPEGDFQEEEG